VFVCEFTAITAIKRIAKALFSFLNFLTPLRKTT